MTIGVQRILVFAPLCHFPPQYDNPLKIRKTISFLIKGNSCTKTKVIIRIYRTTGPITCLEFCLTLNMNKKDLTIFLPLTVPKRCPTVFLSFYVLSVFFLCMMCDVQLLLFCVCVFLCVCSCNLCVICVYCAWHSLLSPILYH